MTCPEDEVAFIEASLVQFLEICFLYWLEALSFLDRVQDGIVSLHALCACLKVKFISLKKMDMLIDTIET